MTQTVDVGSYTFTEERQCEMACGRPATVVAKGCMDREPVAMCDQCLKRGLDLVSKVVHMYQKHNRKVLICGDCHRPIFALDTHLDVKQLCREPSP